MGITTSIQCEYLKKNVLTVSTEALRGHSTVTMALRFFIRVKKMSFTKKSRPKRIEHIEEWQNTQEHSKAYCGLRRRSRLSNAVIPKNTTLTLHQ